MKNQLYFTNEKGFILPSMSLLIFILFIIFLANISIYHLELNMHHHLLKRIEIESLIQLGVETYKNDLETSEKILQNAQYEFPQGKVNIFAIEALTESMMEIKMTIESEQQEQYSVDLTIPLLNH